MLHLKIIILNISIRWSLSSFNFFGAKIVTDDSNSWVGMWLIFFPSNIFVIASSHPFLSALGMSRWWNSYLQHGWLLSFSIMEKKFLFLVFVISRNSNDVRLDGAVIFTKKCCSGALFIWENHDTQRKQLKNVNFGCVSSLPFYWAIFRRAEWIGT